MLEKTDFETTKKIAMAFLYTQPQFIEDFPFMCAHPFFEYTVLLDKDNKTMLDIRKRQDFLKAIKLEEEKIQEYSNVHILMAHVRKADRITFFKYINEYLSKEDFGSLLVYSWITSENGNQDVNVHLDEINKYFKMVDKKYIMSKDEQKVFTELSDKITVYRGVGENRNPQGISYTLDYNKAKWFADRYNGNNGYVITKEINKKDVLAYLNSRGESEIVVDYDICKKTEIV